MDNFLLWHQLKKYVKYNDLKEIAAADYEANIEEHYSALCDIYESNRLPKRLLWEPLEVISLTRWAAYTENNSHLMEIVLFCCILLMSTCQRRENTEPSSECTEGQAENIIIALDCACKLQGDWLSLYDDFLAQIISQLQLTDTEEDYLFFHLACYLTGHLLNAKNSDQRRSDLIAAEKAVIAHTTYGPFDEYIDYTYYNQRKKLWNQYLAPVKDELYQLRRFDVFGEPR